MVLFWEDSLVSNKILKKLTYKEATGKQRLSEKEHRLKLFLLGENMHLLLELEADSTTRKYGELAVMNKHELIDTLTMYFNNGTC